MVRGDPDINTLYWSYNVDRIVPNGPDPYVESDLLKFLISKTPDAGRWPFHVVAGVTLCIESVVSFDARNPVFVEKWRDLRCTKGTLCLLTMLSDKGCKNGKGFASVPLDLVAEKMIASVSLESGSLCRSSTPSCHVPKFYGSDSTCQTCDLGRLCRKPLVEWWVSLRFSVTFELALSLFSHMFILTRAIFFQGYELLNTSCEIGKVLRRCNNETLLEPSFLRPLWKADIASRGFKLSISMAILKKCSYHARSVSPSFYSMVNSSLRSRFTRWVAANLWINNPCSCLKLVTEPRSSE
ncbi:hypothetical protein CRG98_031176 [Punica granatum]|uniref:Uncharacterized protein n=1 Tax=Punica granatum TaxID=22663 RepID=A0A2I0IWR4_PUNGR|nr:hypothetical protein CRG98_031176 [Punica granatum]